MEIDDNSIKKLIFEAKKACTNSYSPYSNYPVGSSILSDDGKIFSGTNVENSSYGLCICAERNAIFSGITEGLENIIALVLYTPTDKPTTPCGACRQVLSEFSSNATIICVCDSEERDIYCLKDLLPNSFNLKDSN